MPKVYRDEDGKVIEVQMDEVITDPEHELAVQIPPEADGSQDHPLAPLLEPSPEEIFAAEAAEPSSDDEE